MSSKFVRNGATPLAASAASAAAARGRRRLATSPLEASAASAAAARAAVRARDYEAYLCGALQPSRARGAFFAARAFALEVAAARGAARGHAAPARARLSFWADVAAAAGAGEAGPHPLSRALADAARAHGWTGRYLARLVEARLDDLDAPPPASVAALDARSARAHTPLLLLALEAVGVRDDAAADAAAGHVGAATGIAAVLRGLPVHARLRERHVPDDVLARAGLGPADLVAEPHEVLTPTGERLAEPPPPQQQQQQQQHDLGAAAAAAAARPAPSQLDSHAALDDGSTSHSPLREPPRGVRLMAGGASAAARAQRPPPPPPLPAPRASPSSQEVGLRLRPAGYVSDAALSRPADPASEAAAALLRSGAGAAGLRLVKPPAVAAGVRAAVKELADAARAHLAAAAALQARVPLPARAALLPAAPVARFLDRLAAQGHDVFAAGGLGPWADGRPTATLRLQAALLRHAVLNTYA